jgi:transposase
MAVHGRTLRRGTSAEERMRGDHSEPDAMFSYISAAQRVPKDHPLRAIRTMVDDVLRRLWSDFDRLYARTGRPSIPPERLLRALLLQVLYSIRSERMLMEQLDYNLLFRWFVGLSMDDRIWDATVFTKNRDRLLRGDIAVRFFEQVLAEARERGLTSDEHFTVDGTLVEAWAGLKSFKRKDRSDGQNPPDDPGNPTVNFHGQKRSNRTHESTTDPDSLLARKGKSHEAKLYFMGHVVMENRGGLAVGARLTRATGHAEREAALAMVGEMPRHRRISVGADKGYDVASFVEELREQDVTPHIAQKARYSALDGRTTRHVTY